VVSCFKICGIIFFFNYICAIRSLFLGVRGWWASYQFLGTPSFILAKILRALKGDIKNWNTSIFGNVGALIKGRVDELKALEIAAEGGGLSEVERERKACYAGILKELFFKRKSVGGKNPESSGLRREISALNFST
jgi:hypothetical protein